MLLEIPKSGRTALAMLIEWLSRGTRISIDDAKHVDLLEGLDAWGRLTAQSLALADLLPVAHAHREAIRSAGNLETSVVVDAWVLPVAAQVRRP